MQLLSIRINQLKRVGKELGPLYTTIFMGLVILFYYGAIILFDQLPDKNLPRSGYAICLLVVIFSLHIRRKDRTFLALYIDIVRRHRIYMTEYLIAASPILMYMLISSHFIQGLISLLGIFAISMSSITIRRYSVKPKAVFKRWLNEFTLEWISALRKNWMGIAGIYLLLLGAISLNPYSIIIAWLILVSYLPTVYEHFEPVQLIENNTYSTGKFLIKKSWNHFLVISGFGSPLLIIFLYPYPEFYFLALAGLVVTMLFIIWVNYVKYGYYSHAQANSTTYKYMLSISILLLFVALPIVYLLMLFKWNWFKDNLEYYLTND